MQNTPKTRDIQCDFSKKSGNLPFCMQKINNFNTFCEGKTPKNRDFLQQRQFLQFYMWFYKGIKVNISATTQKFIVALIYKTNPVQITTIIAQNTENSLNSVSHTIESSIQICEKFSPIVKLKFGIFLKCHGYCYTIIANCSYAKHQRQQLISHKVYCKEKCTKVLQTRDFLSHTHFMFSGVTNAIGNISQDKQQLNTSNKNVNLGKNTINTKYSLTT